MIAITLYRTEQTAHDTGKYVAIETRVFPDTASLREVMNWATGNGERFVDWHDLVFSRVTIADRALPEGHQ